MSIQVLGEAAECRGLSQRVQKNSKSSLKARDEIGPGTTVHKPTAKSEWIAFDPPTWSRCNFDVFFPPRMELSVPVAGERSRLQSPLFVQLLNRCRSEKLMLSG